MNQHAARPCLLVVSKGAQAIPTLPALLADYRLLNGSRHDLARADAILAWGRKPSARQAIAMAAQVALPVLTIEDGFLRSVGLGSDEPPLSMIVDDLGVYHDASAPSRLETLIAQPLTHDQVRRAETLCQLWRRERVSKYNTARITPVETTRACILVADQTVADASLQGATAADFQAMLDAALAAHPDCDVLLKVHPDVLAGRKKGHFDLARLAGHPRIVVTDRDIHPAELLPAMQAVYVMTSQLGFDALMWNVPVFTWGMPFYAGWGLTTDRLAAPPRRQPASLAQLVYATLVGYSRYVDPETGQACTPETLMHWLGLQRRQRSLLPDTLQLLGFSRWKHPLARHFLDGSRLRFLRSVRHLDHSLAVASWGSRHDHDLSSHTGTVHRVEDGFLRSVGLGAHKHRPLSWIVDDLGIYYDATRPSRLERILDGHAFDAALLHRGRMLRQAICNAGITKYNLPGEAWQRPLSASRVMLVTGQVPDDASIRLGASHIRSNVQLLQAVRSRHPDAWLLYKPHPEVLAGTRTAGIDETQATHWCDEVIGNTPLDRLFEQVDEVHVLTSQSGFEALMRGVPVTTYGQPFYAGWGLTEDCGLMPEVQARRRRRLDLDALVAGTLILYPTYVSRITNRFTSAEQALHELQHWHELPACGPTGWQNVMRYLNLLRGQWGERE